MRDAVIVEAVRTPVGKGKPGGALSGIHAGRTVRRQPARRRRAQRHRPGVDRRRDRRRRRPGRRAGDEHHPLRGAGRRAARVGAGDHHRPAVRLVAAGGALRRPGPDRGRLRHRHRRRRREHEPGADVVERSGRRRPLRPGHRRALPRRPGAAGHQRRADRRQVGPARAGSWTPSPPRATAAPRPPPPRGASPPRSCRSRRPTPTAACARSPTDESIRPGTTVETLAGLKPAFHNPEMGERFPQIDWSVTAGNASPINDGSAALLMMTSEKAARARPHPEGARHQLRRGAATTRCSCSPRSSRPRASCSTAPA